MASILNFPARYAAPTEQTIFINTNSAGESFVAMSEHEDIRSVISTLESCCDFLRGYMDRD